MILPKIFHAELGHRTASLYLHTGITYPSGGKLSSPAITKNTRMGWGNVAGVPFEGPVGNAQAEAGAGVGNPHGGGPTTDRSIGQPSRRSPAAWTIARMHAWRVLGLPGHAYPETSILAPPVPLLATVGCGVGLDRSPRPSGPSGARNGLLHAC